MIARFSYSSKSKFKMSGRAIFLGETDGKIGLNVEKIVISLGLKQGLCRSSLAHQNTQFYTFSDQIHPLKSQKAPKKLKNSTFGQITNKFLPSPSPYFGAKFHILLCPPLPLSQLHQSKFDHQPKFCFLNLCLSKVIEESLWG